MEREIGMNHRHFELDVRGERRVGRPFEKYPSDISVAIRPTAQPSHDWVANDPMADFSINATGTLNLLEVAWKHRPDALVKLTSTNKVYGDTPNRLPLQELETRWEIELSRPDWVGIREDMSTDHRCLALEQPGGWWNAEESR